MNLVQIAGRNRQILAEAVGIAQGAEVCDQHSWNKVVILANLRQERANSRSPGFAEHFAMGRFQQQGFVPRRLAITCQTCRRSFYAHPYRSRFTL